MQRWEYRWVTKSILLSNLKVGIFIEKLSLSRVCNGVSHVCHNEMPSSTYILSFCTIIGWNPSQNRGQINIIAPCREQKNTCLLWTWNFLCLFSMIVIVCVPSKIHLKLENRWWNTITTFDIQMSAEKEPLTRFIFSFLL